jgi:ribosomal protein L5
MHRLGRRAARIQGVPPKSFYGRRGMHVTICATPKNDEDGRAFLKAMGLRLRER